MKKTILSLFFLVLLKPILACADGDIDGGYFNLLSQEIVEDEHFHPFLLTYDLDYYGNNYGYYEEPQKPKTNFNLQEWQTFFENTLNYDEVKALIFNTEKEDFTVSGRKKNTLLQKIPSTKIDAVASYLYWAKVIEPYAVNNQWNEQSWSDDPKKKINDETLDYKKILSSLTSAYKNENRSELKLRYAYQMVRLAHYYYHFQEAIDLFDTYAEPLQCDKEIYYYALEQKAGALHGLNKVNEANYYFVKVFAHSKDRLESAMSSIIIYEDPNLAYLETKLTDPQELAALYLMQARKEFQNPLAYLQKIDAIKPNSAYSQVVWMRAINELERSLLYLSGTCNGNYYHDNSNCKEQGNRIPTYDVQNNTYLNSLLAYSEEISAQEKTAFYYLTNAYLHFVRKDFSKAKEVLSLIKTPTAKQKEQITYLKMLIDVSEPEKLSADFEQKFFQNYKETLQSIKFENYTNGSWYQSDYVQYILDVLGNRYFLQNEKGKSFLCHNGFETLEYNQDLVVINDLESFYHKKNKTPLEQLLLKNFKVSDADFINKIHDFRGTYYIKKNLADLALQEYNQISDTYKIVYQKWDDTTEGLVPYTMNGHEFDGYGNISNKIFWMNYKECYECPEAQVMTEGATQEFKFIKEKMNKKEVAVALVALQKLGSKNNEKAALANQLLGNFYYNITDLGYYRNIFHYDLSNGNSSQFDAYYWRYYYTNEGEEAQAQPINYKLNIWEYKSMADTHFSTAYYIKALENLKNDELKAEILYGAAKAEQGNFYYDLMRNKINIPEIENLENASREEQLAFLKMKGYKNAFAELKKYPYTKAYKETLHRCKFFQYYLSQ